MKVWKDEVSGLIFIDEYYTGNVSYNKVLYRDENSTLSQTGIENFKIKMQSSDLKQILNFSQVRK